MKAANLEAPDLLEAWIADLDARRVVIEQLPIDAVPALQADVVEIWQHMDCLQRLERASSDLRRILGRLIIRGSVP